MNLSNKILFYLKKEPKGYYSKELAKDLLKVSNKYYDMKKTDVRAENKEADKFLRDETERVFSKYISSEADVWHFVEIFISKVKMFTRNQLVMTYEYILRLEAQWIESDPDVFRDEEMETY